MVFPAVCGMVQLLDRERGLEALRAQGDVERVKVARLQEEVNIKKQRKTREGKSGEKFPIRSTLHYLERACSAQRVISL